MDDNQLWFRMWLLASLTFLCIIGGLLYADSVETSRMTDKGYIYRSVPVRYEGRWVKP